MPTNPSEQLIAEAREAASAYRQDAEDALGGESTLWIGSTRALQTAETFRQLADALATAQQRIQEAEASANEAADAITAIVAAYDGYRGRGVLPAPDEYQRMVGAINDARAHLKVSDNA